MTTVGLPRMRWVSLLGLVMMILSATPWGVAAQSGLVPGGDVAQADGKAIELLIVDCPPGAPDDPSDLIPGCTEGPANIGVNVSSIDPAQGVNLPKTTVQVNGTGPGIINTDVLPLGQYLVSIDLPTEQNRFFFECVQRGTETVVPTSPSPNGDQNAFVVQNDAAVDIVCRAFVTPTGEAPIMEITYRECDRADFPSDSREITDLQANCTTISTNPPTINVRDLNVAGEPVTEHQLDAEGKLDLTLAPGNFEMFTDLDMDQWGEYLFCEYEGQPIYEKEFHPTRGIVEFSNLLMGEKFTCQWFGVSAADTGDAAQPQETVTETATATETEIATETATATETQEAIAPLQTTDVTFTVTYRECTRGDLSGDDRSWEQLSANCVTVPAPGPIFTIRDTGSTTGTQQNLDAAGVLTFTHPASDFEIYTNLPMESWGEYLFCSFDGGAQYSKPFSNDGINTFSDLNAGETFTCSWFGVNTSDTPTTPIEPPASETANINLKLIACESEESVGDLASLDAFRTNCTTGIENTIFTLANDASDTRTAITLPTGETSFADVPDGNWNLWSEIPLEAATEYYFCSIDSGDYTAMTLSDRGAARFEGVDGQQITCEVYVVPEDLRGEITGSSVEVHLALCPVGYDGSAWYADCHANGIGDMPFTLTGPAGELTANTVVENTPGPGIVRFTELPAGDYILAGGPPQDFGSVFLYCSDPSTNTRIDTTFDGGRGSFTLAENQSIVCDWYFTPDDQGMVTPTVTPEPSRAEIFTTMFVCPQGVNVAGSSFGQLDSACTQTLNDVPMALQSPGGVPITANTGASGDGAVRFYDLLPGNYVLTPKLPTEYVSAAVYCDLDGGPVYQKALSNGATTFVNVDGELISCSWFVTAKQPPTQGPTGSITIREMLCEGDRSSIKDWERECQPGASGVSFTITSSGGGVTQTLAPNDSGVAVFSSLPNEYYEIRQSEGAWCRAKAERVDAQSRVIVANGGNTDVFLYQCNQQIGLPDTGAGPLGGSTAAPMTESLLLGSAALPLFAIAAWQIRRWQSANNATEPVTVHAALTRTRSGYRYR